MESNRILSRVEKKSALGQWNTSVTGHIAGRVFSAQHTNLPRSTANSSVCMSRTLSSSGLGSSLAYLNVTTFRCQSRLNDKGQRDLTLHQETSFSVRLNTLIQF